MRVPAFEELRNALRTGNSRYIFQSAGEQKPISTTTVGDIYKRLATEAGIPLTSLHWLRHAAAAAAATAAASTANESEANLDQIKELCRHNSSKTTARYIHSNENIQVS